MTEQQEKFLQNLIECPGPSNYEENVQKLWRNEVSPVIPEITIDAYGNNVATLKGSENISIMIVGHSDEIGLIVRYINSEGFIYVSRVGGVDPSILPSHRVRILSSKTGGMVN